MPRNCVGQDELRGKERATELGRDGVPEERERGEAGVATAGGYRSVMHAVARELKRVGGETCNR